MDEQAPELDDADKCKLSFDTKHIWTTYTQVYIKLAKYSLISDTGCSLSIEHQLKTIQYPNFLNKNDC